LFIADSGNFRVHAFIPPFADGMDATLAIGQADLLGSEAAVASRTSVGFPVDVAFDQNGNLWVVDLGNSRVLRFPSPFSTGMEADLVLGQVDFVSGSPSLTESGMNNPLGVALDVNGDAFVADAANSRILEFKTPLFSVMSASVVLGQTDFTSGGGNTTRSGLNVPVGLSFDSSGNLWVSDNNNNRVLKFAQPFTIGMNASIVLGQADFFSNVAAAPGKNNLHGPYGIAVDGSGDVFVADSSNIVCLNSSCR
jgi:sugar lactone lactonase YvrE